MSSVAQAATQGLKSSSLYLAHTLYNKHRTDNMRKDMGYSTRVVGLA